MAATHPLLERFDSVEYGICRKFNRVADRKWPCRLFQAASWLGNGIVWYMLAGALLMAHGAAAAPLVAAMTITGLSGVAIYKYLKVRLIRERPCIRHAGIRRAMAPLDRYSFPSGHTMHAVSFTWQVVTHFPELGWILIPLAAQIALSRVVLGLHYPSDVLAGAVLGSGLAAAGVALAA